MLRYGAGGERNRGQTEDIATELLNSAQKRKRIGNSAYLGPTKARLTVQLPEPASFGTKPKRPQASRLEVGPSTLVAFSLQIGGWSFKLEAEAGFLVQASTPGRACVRVRQSSSPVRGQGPGRACLGDRAAQP